MVSGIDVRIKGNGVTEAGMKVEGEHIRAVWNKYVGYKQTIQGKLELNFSVMLVKYGVRCYWETRQVDDCLHRSS